MVAGENLDSVGFGRVAGEEMPVIPDVAFDKVVLAMRRCRVWHARTRSGVSV